jgi:chemotaxis signal transduction protein
VDDEWVAATVDGVLDVSALDAARLAPPPALFRGLTASYVRGVVRRGDRLVVFLDVPHLFSTDERIALERPLEEPARNG